MPNWARIALRMKSLLFGRLLRNRANSSSTLNATISDLAVLLAGLRGMAGHRKDLELPNLTASGRTAASRPGARPSGNDPARPAGADRAGGDADLRGYFFLPPPRK